MEALTATYEANRHDFTPSGNPDDNQSKCEVCGFGPRHPWHQESKK